MNIVAGCGKRTTQFPWERTTITLYWLFNFILRQLFKVLDWRTKGKGLAPRGVVCGCLTLRNCSKFFWSHVCFDSSSWCCCSSAAVIMPLSPKTKPIWFTWTSSMLLAPCSEFCVPHPESWACALMASRTRLGDGATGQSAKSLTNV